MSKLLIENFKFVLRFNLPAAAKGQFMDQLFRHVQCRDQVFHQDI
jgi:hypothetical protein